MKLKTNPIVYPGDVLEEILKLRRQNANYEFKRQRKARREATKAANQAKAKVTVCY